MPDKQMKTRKNVLATVLPKMARFQANLENAITDKETGRHQVSVQIVDGVIQKVQVFTEDSTDLSK